MKPSMVDGSLMGNSCFRA